MATTTATEIDPQRLGYVLLKAGFPTWFQYLFAVVEGRRFVREALHKDLFGVFDDIHSGKITRQIINIPPRSAKTTIAKYFIVYCWTINPCCNFIYSSYSQSLLTGISREMALILEHPVYKAMYPIKTTLTQEEAQPVDDFWREYLMRETGRNVYGNSKIVTYKGGVCLFSSIGGQITGYGAGIRNGKGFTGALIIDDANKPADIRSELMRDKVVRYYEETLLSRLNQSSVPIINIQQRLHLEDLSGTLLDKYHFSCLKRPLLDENGTCLLPSQYTPERIAELQINNYVFSAQYQQEPTVLGGGVFKDEWWRFYSPKDFFRYRRVYITADTAMKTGEENDFTAIAVWGVTIDRHLHLLDLVHGKFEAPDLEPVFVSLYQKWLNPVNSSSARCSAIYVEDKASGIGLIQSIRRKGLPIIPIEVTKDKYTRALEAVPMIASGNVFLPNSASDTISRMVIKECQQFTAEMTHLHDDIVDVLCYGIDKAYSSGGII